MPIGVLTNAVAALAGGALGSLLSRHMPRTLLEQLPALFGYCAIAIGVNAIIKAANMTAVVLAVLAGFCAGHGLKLERRTQALCGQAVTAARLGGISDMNLYITLVALLCFSGFGWYGALTESISGSPDILFSKSALDFFTAMLFGSALGWAVCLIPIGQAAVMLLVFLAGKLAAPFFTAEAFMNLSACGGILTLATGLRIANIKSIPIIDAIPALALAWPLSALLRLLG